MRARTRGPRSFDAVAVGQREADAWSAYYRHDWVAFMRASVGMVAAGFGMNRPDTVRGAWLVLRANQAWARGAGRRCLRRGRRTCASARGRARGRCADREPTRAAALEVEWWRVHREHQYGAGAVTTETLVEALVALYAYVHAADPDVVRPAARWRVEAMDRSDEWVRGGCSLGDPRLAEVRRALVASYAALLDAAVRARV